jgi:mitochondrial import inner membrane translocase subunit TIM16
MFHFIQEAKQILNISDADVKDIEKIGKHYEHLFSVNDKSKGGSFYLQSKIFRAKERIDQDLRGSSKTSTDSKTNPSDANPS